MKIIKKTIRIKIKIYPYLGNHEKIQLEEYYGSEIILLNDLEDILKENLSKDVKLFFWKYGYYTILNKDNKLKSVSLNYIIFNCFIF